MKFAEKLRTIRKQTGMSQEKLAEAFDIPDADNLIELNGIKSELDICTEEDYVSRN